MKFQYILLSVFGLAAVIAVIIFSLPAKKDPTAVGSGGVVQIWGTFPSTEGSRQIIEDFNKIYKGTFSISYQFHDPKDFDNDIVRGLLRRLRRLARAVPRGGSAASVGMRGSSQPATNCSSTKFFNLRLLVRVWVKLSRENSICCGRGAGVNCAKNQSYSGR